MGGIYLPKKLYEDPAFFQQKYVVERLSIKEISRLTFSSRWLVRKGLREARIELRNQRQQGKTRSQLAFGEAWRRIRIAIHKHEEDIFQKMLKLRAEGLSFHKITHALNAWGIPTKRRKGKWSGKQIHQILYHRWQQSFPVTEEEPTP